MANKRYRKEYQAVLPNIAVYIVNKGSTYVQKVTLNSVIPEWGEVYCTADKIQKAIFDGRKLFILESPRIKTVDVAKALYDGYIIGQGHLYETSPRTMAFGYLPATLAKTIEAIFAVRALAAFPPGLLPICAAYLIEEVLAIGGVRGITVLNTAEKRVIWEYNHGLGMKPYMCFGADGTLNVLPIYREILCLSSNGKKCSRPWHFTSPPFDWGNWGGIATDERGYTYISTHTALSAFSLDGRLVWRMENRFQFITDLAYDAVSGVLLVAETVSRRYDSTFRIHVVAVDGQYMFYKDLFERIINSPVQICLATFPFKAISV